MVKKEVLRHCLERLYIYANSQGIDFNCKILARLFSEFCLG